EAVWLAERRTSQSRDAAGAEAAEQVQDVILEPADQRRLAMICGQFDEHRRQIEQQVGVRIKNRGNHFELSGTGDGHERARAVVEDRSAQSEDEGVAPERVHMAVVEHSRAGGKPAGDPSIIHTRRRSSRARGASQIAYTTAMRERDLTLG